MQAEGDVVGFPAAEERPARLHGVLRRGAPGLFKALYFVTGNRADAAELMQDAFLKLWERWDRVDRIDDPTGYLFRVALNGSRMRARAARPGHAEAGAGRLDRPTRSTRSTSGEDVHRMLLELSPRQRAALVLLDLYGYGSEEAARIMGIRPSTVRALATQGRAVLRKQEARMAELREVFEMVTKQTNPTSTPGRSRSGVSVGRAGTGSSAPSRSPPRSGSWRWWS